MIDIERLTFGGGGGDSSDVKQGVRNLEIGLTKIQGKLEDMPTKDWMNARLLAYLGVSLTIIGLMIKFL